MATAKPVTKQDDPFAVTANYLKKAEVEKRGKRFTVTDIQFDATNEYKNKPRPRWLVTVEGGENGLIDFDSNPIRDKSMQQAREKLPIVGAMLVKEKEAYRLTTQ